MKNKPYKVGDLVVFIGETDEWLVNGQVYEVIDVDEHDVIVKGDINGSHGEFKHCKPILKRI